LFGVGRNPSDGDFDAWLVPGGTEPVFFSGYGGELECTTGVEQTGLPTSNCNPAFTTELEFIGPNSPNPAKTATPSDWNNFGPAVGFAYQVPWLGGRTTVRGGYQITYGAAGRNTSTIGGGDGQVLGAAPGSTSNTGQASILNNQFPNQYIDLTRVAEIVPLAPVNPAVPGGTLDIAARAGTIYGYANDFSTPYTQNFNLSVTTNLGRNMAFDIRYIGTQSRKQQNDINLNINNIYFNDEFREALEITRMGGDASLLDQIFAGLNLSGAPASEGYAAIGTQNTAGVYQSASSHLRRRTTGGFNQNLLDGNLPAVVNNLLTSTTATGFVSAPGAGGRITRNGCDRIAAQEGGTTFGPDNIVLRCLPENYFITNPQLTTDNFRANTGTSNYHAMQAQFTLRATQGFNFQGTYSWSKTMEVPGSGTANPLDRKADYARAISSQTHDFRANGGIRLPIGPGQLLLGNSSGWLARVVEGWETNAILVLSSGTPVSITALGGLTYGTTTPVVVGDFDIRKADYVFDGDNNRGIWFGETNPFVPVEDPQCQLADAPDAMGFNLYDVGCNLQAIARVVPAGTPGAQQLDDGQWAEIVLQNPLPGQQGNLGLSTFEQNSVFRLDANISKRFQIDERRSVQIRIDATNVLNHPTPTQATAGLSINNENFGFAVPTGANPGKSGSRVLQAQVRLDF
jgi:hypothetical protein